MPYYSFNKVKESF